MDRNKQKYSAKNVYMYIIQFAFTRISKSFAVRRVRDRTRIPVIRISHFLIHLVLQKRLPHYIIPRQLPRRTANAAY